MAPLLIGLFGGVCLGLYEFRFFGVLNIKLGLAGGAFIVSVLMGHFGRLGPFNLHVPQAAKNLCRELGLIIFLAAAGLHAGGEVIPALSQYGLKLFLASCIVSLAAICSFLYLSVFYLRENGLATLGGLCGVMTNSAGLATVREDAPRDLPCIVYSALFLISLIAKIIFGQHLVLILGLG